MRRRAHASDTGDLWSGGGAPALPWAAVGRNFLCRDGTREAATARATRSADPGRSVGAALVAVAPRHGAAGSSARATGA